MIKNLAFIFMITAIAASYPAQANKPEDKVFDLLLKADDLNELIPKQKELKAKINKFEEDCRIDTATGTMGNTTKDCQQKLDALLQELNQNPGVRQFNAEEMKKAASTKVREQEQEQPFTPRGPGAGMPTHLERQKLIFRGNPSGKSKQPGSESRTTRK